MFNVICIETGEPVRDSEGNATIYANGREAAANASYLSTLLGKKHQPRPCKDVDWKAREQARMTDGTYTALPWADLKPEDLIYWTRYGGPDDLRRKREELWFNRAIADRTELADLFPHVSSKVPGNIAFTETPEKGAADIQTTMKPGRFLTRFFSDTLPKDSIRHLAQEFLATYGDRVLLFADTEDEIERVYTNGPRSCMSHSAGDFIGPIHPARVYAAGDLAVAYLVAKDEDIEHITARCVCWPSKLRYSRIYGDDKIAHLLDAQGYKEGNLDGARLLRVPYRDGFVVPYVDGCAGASDNGDFLILDVGCIATDSTSGVSVSVGRCCNCDSEIDEADYSFDTDDGTMCESCYDENSFSFYCSYNEERITGDNYVTMANGDLWSQRAFDRYGYTCDGNGENYSSDAEPRIEMADGDIWSETHFNAYGFICDDCGANFRTNDGDGCCCDLCLETAKAAEEEETCDTYDNEGDHVVTPGRDESVDQTELALAAINEALALVD